MRTHSLSPLAMAALEQARSQLGLAPVHKHHVWSEAEERSLIARYPNEPTQVLAAELGSQRLSGLCQSQSGWA